MEITPCGLRVFLSGKRGSKTFAKRRKRTHGTRALQQPRLKSTSSEKGRWNVVIVSQRIITNRLNMKKYNFWKIITEDLGICTVCSKLVPRLQNDEQVFLDIIERLHTKLDLLCRIITGLLSMTRKTHGKTVCGSLQCRRGRRKQDKFKIIMIPLIDGRGIVHDQLLLQDHTINKQVYNEFLRSMFCSGW